MKFSQSFMDVDTLCRGNGFETQISARFQSEIVCDCTQQIVGHNNINN